MKAKFIVTLAVLAAAVGTVYAARAAAPKGALMQEQRLARRSRGNPEAPIWVVEYADFQCPSCRASFPLLDAYFKINPGKIYWQLRSYPLFMTHRYALKSAIYAECASSQGRFWPFSEALFRQQDAWKDSPDADALFHGYARDAGLDLNKLDACVDDPATKQTLIDEKEAASALGVRLTPTFFINGKMVVGDQPLKEALDQALAALTGKSRS